MRIKQTLRLADSQACKNMRVFTAYHLKLYFGLEARSVWNTKQISRYRFKLYLNTYADMAELADAHGSGHATSV